MTLADLIWLSGDPSVRLDGAAPQSDQKWWEARGFAEPSGVGNGFSQQFEHDLDLMADSGLRAIRLPIDWARVEPFPGRADHGEIEKLEAIYAAANERNIAVWTTLHHGSLPGWFSEDTNGFCTASGPSIHWSRHVEAMAEHFDPLTHLWAPVDDPIGWAVSAYHLGTHPPGRKVTPAVGGKLVDSLIGALDATFEAHRILSSGDKPVAGVFRPPLVRAGNSPDGDAYDDERKWWDDVFWNSWTGALREGELIWPGRARASRPDMAEAFDLLIIGTGNIDSAEVVEAGEDGRLTPISQPAGGVLADTLHRAAELAPGYDLVVAGIGADAGNETQQLKSIELRLSELAASITDGLPITGAMLEPLIDGYDHGTGMWSDTGLFTTDREPKASYRLFEAQR